MALRARWDGDAREPPRQWWKEPRCLCQAKWALMSPFPRHCSAARLAAPHSSLNSCWFESHRWCPWWCPCDVPADVPDMSLQCRCKCPCWRPVNVPAMSLQCPHECPYNVPAMSLQCPCHVLADVPADVLANVPSMSQPCGIFSAGPWAALAAQSFPPSPSSGISWRDVPCPAAQGWTLPALLCPFPWAGAADTPIKGSSSKIILN